MVRADRHPGDFRAVFSRVLQIGALKSLQFLCIVTAYDACESRVRNKNKKRGEKLPRFEPDVDALRTAEESADQTFQILDQMEGVGLAKAR